MTTVTYFQGSQIYPFRDVMIRAFLSPAPTSVEGVDFDHITELVETSCEEVEG